jgi:prepilin-type N-terminal cleavage/methylation domain-containing protein
MKRKDKIDSVFFGMTLVELLVVMAIMAILVAISIPSLKPMLESQRAANGARAVATKLQQTRLKAMRENRPCGVEFMRFDSEPRASLQMRNVKDTPNFIRLEIRGGTGSSEVRCVVVPNGDGTATIRLVKGTFVTSPEHNDDRIWTEINTGSPAEGIDTHIVERWRAKVLPGLSIQFNRQGRWFRLEDSFTVIDCDDPLPTNQTLVGGAYPEAVSFNVTQRPASMLNSVTVLPRGTVIDLVHSGREVNMARGSGVDFDNAATPTYVTQSVIVMFSPTGYVDRFYIDGTEGNKPFNGITYLLVGEWDKIDSGEDGKNNLATESNFWVTIKDRDGTVRISPNSSDGTNIENRRKHAHDDLSNNIGGL